MYVPRTLESFLLTATKQFPVLLVTGASQGAHTVNQVMMRVWPDFHAARPEWQLLHLTGAADEAEVKGAYAAAGGTWPQRASDAAAKSPPLVLNSSLRVRREWVMAQR